MNPLVVGEIGDDHHLGRTFFCETTDDAWRALELLFGENGVESPPEKEYWDDNCEWVSPSGRMYFVGGLETVGD